jgi:hypothetical protein
MPAFPAIHSKYESVRIFGTAGWARTIDLLTRLRRNLGRPRTILRCDRPTRIGLPLSRFDAAIRRNRAGPIGSVIDSTQEPIDLSLGRGI